MSMTTGSESQAKEWVNWFGNQRCHPNSIKTARSEAEVQQVIRYAADAGQSVRVVGAGHSLTPVGLTDGVLLNPKIDTDLQVDLERGTAHVGPGQTVEQVSEALWAAGASPLNLGELKEATLIGAMSTGVHGTGVGLGCLATAMRGARMVTAEGEIRTIAEEDTDLLRAARISLGMLGVLTDVTVDIQPAAYLRERSFFCTPEELAARWDELAAGHRHFSFFYIPDASCIAEFAYVVPQIMAALNLTGATALSHVPSEGDTCLVSLRDIAPKMHPEDLGQGERFGRFHDILTYDFKDPYREVECGVPFEIGAETFLEMRERVRTRHSTYKHPMLTRCAAEDDALLSWFQGGPKAVFSVVDDPGADYGAVLADFETFFDERQALPHWGKEHSLTPARLARLQPGLEPFRALRRKHDQAGMFLNDHLRELFA